MTTINFVNLSNILPTNAKVCDLLYGYRPSAAQLLDYPIWYDYNLTKAFFIKFLEGLKPDEFYFFITQTQLTEIWEEVIQEYQLEKYQIFRSREPAENYNYPEEGPRLTAWMFKGFNSPQVKEL